MFGVGVVVAADLLGYVVLVVGESLLLGEVLRAMVPPDLQGGRLNTIEMLAGAALIFTLTSVGGLWLRLSGRALLSSAVFLQFMVFCMVGLGTGFSLPNFYSWLWFFSLYVAVPHHGGAFALCLFRAFRVGRKVAQ